MAKRPTRGEGVTRQRILKAAVRRFGAHSYEDTSLRDVAQDVGVDVAYVHRCFGSKEKLFLEALGAASEEVDLTKLTREEIAAYLVHRLFEEPRGKLVPDISSFDIIIRSMFSGQVASFVNQRVQDEFLDPLADKLKDQDGSCVTMVMSLLVGFAVLRDFFQWPPATHLKRERAETALTRTIQEIMDNPAICSTGEDSMSDVRGV